MNKYSKYDVVFVDTESTGPDVEKDEIIEISVIRDNKFENTRAVFTQRIKPGIVCSEEAAKINGYSHEEWKNEPSFFIAWKSLCQSIFTFSEKYVVVGFFGSSFDKLIIQNNCSKYRVENPFVKWIDLADITWPLVTNGYIDSRSLKSLCDYYGIVNNKPHSALGDTEVTREIYWRYINEHKAGVLTLEAARFLTKTTGDKIKGLYNKITGLKDGREEKNSEKDE